jgi:two-component system, OmpR family, response regulator
MNTRTDKRSPVIIVDDDPEIRETVSNYFEVRNLSTLTAADQQALLRLLAYQRPRLILLDLRLGTADGYDFLRSVRSTSDVPIIVMTGHHVEESDWITGLDSGADDYVTKPFRLGELLARVRAVLRRRELMDSGRPPKLRVRQYRFAGWTLNREDRTLTSPTQLDVELTKGEFGLLITLLECPQQPLARDYLVAATRHHDDIFDRTIDVLIMRLRRKIEVDRSTPRIIVTERRVGYTLAVKVDKIYRGT